MCCNAPRLWIPEHSAKVTHELDHLLLDLMLSPDVLHDQIGCIEVVLTNWADQSVILTSVQYTRLSF